MKADAVVVVSDDTSTLGSTKPKIGANPYFSCTTLPQLTRSTLPSHAQSGGAYINLRRQDSTSGLDAMTNHPLRLLSVEGEGVEQVLPSLATPVEQQLSIAGKITQKSLTCSQLRRKRQGHP